MQGAGAGSHIMHVDPSTTFALFEQLAAWSPQALASVHAATGV